MAKIRDEFYVNLKGKLHPTWPGVLIALHEEGLLGIEVDVLQYPAEENGWSAVCQATVTMRGDGERELVYRDVGDCSPKNASPMIALASLRMASTRAKGRAGRDAIALGATLFEELPQGGLEDEGEARNAAPHAPAANGKAAVGEARRPDVVPHVTQATPAGNGVESPPAVCQVPACAKPLTKGQITSSQHNHRLSLCPECSKKADQAKEIAAAKAA